MFVARALTQLQTLTNSELFNLNIYIYIESNFLIKYDINLHMKNHIPLLMKIHN